MRIQGPRWRLLVEGKDEFIATLKPFARQKVVILQCGKWGGGAASEPFMLAQYLFMFLTVNKQLHLLGAGWDARVETWDSCPAGGGTSAGGNLILTSSASGNNMQDAAQTLNGVLNKLKIITAKTQFGIEGKSDNAALEKTLAKLPLPWQMVARDPSLAVIVVGDNPMFDIWESGKHQKSRK